MLTQELKNTLTLVLAGGAGQRLKPLTSSRAKPAVPFGGAYRIIDFTLSNCIHSGLRRIYVLTQYQARSLEEHIRFGWNFLPRRLEQFITPRPPHHKSEEKWYAGTADAIYQNLDTIEEEGPEHVLILSGDHIYKMDYGLMLMDHVEKGAALTIGSVEIPQSEARRFGVFEVGAEDAVLNFLEKPDQGPEIPGRPGYCMGSMGIYVFKTSTLLERLRADAEMGDQSNHDFGKDIIPRMIGEEPVFAHRFVDRDGHEEPYWRDVGTLDALYEANLDLCSIEPKLNLYDPKWPVYTLWHNEPPAKTVFAGDDGRKSEVVDTLLCNGAIVSGGIVRRSILSNRVFVDERAVVEDSIIFAGAVIEKGAVVRRAIVEKWVRVPEGEEIGVDLERDRQRFTVTDSGIVVVPSGFEF